MMKLDVYTEFLDDLSFDPFVFMEQEELDYGYVGSVFVVIYRLIGEWPQVRNEWIWLPWNNARPVGLNSRGTSTYLFALL